MCKFTIIGGDKRMVYLANILNDEGFSINTYGIESKDLYSDIEKTQTLEEAIKSTQVIISPLPFSSDNKLISCKYFDNEIEIKTLFENMRKDQLLFAGNVHYDVKKLADNYNVNLHDYSECEELVILNCIPTAEGAIKIAIEELPTTLHGSRCLVLGFGRVGKVLSKMLFGIGAKVTAGARKESDLAWAKSYGYGSLKLEDLERNINDFEIIFNTIPQVILYEGILRRVNKNVLIIDLASKPGGVDYEAAERLDIKTNWALGLPGKVAPYAAAKYIKDAVFNILDQKGVNTNA